MLARLKSFFQTSSQQFRALCRSNQLQLDERLNQGGLPILRSIFQQREYADYFPFYEAANVLDIGGHYGYFSLFAQQHTAPDAQLVTVEPDPANQRVLRANLTANNANRVQVVDAAVGGTSGRQPLYQGESSNHSLLAENEQSSTARAHTVEVITLTDLISQLGWAEVDFLKLDCEGAEYDILLDLPQSTYDRVRVISMEFHDLKRVDRTGNALVAKLRSVGFDIKVFQYSPSNQNLNYGRIVAIRRGSF